MRFRYVTGEQEFTIEPRLAVDAVLGDQVVTAFMALVGFPGMAAAAVGCGLPGTRSSHVEPGDSVAVRPRPGAAHVVRLGRTTFYERARRTLRLTDSAEVPAGWAHHDH